MCFGVHDHLILLPQMLLQKLRGAHCCLLDVAPYPLGELGGLKVSRSGVDSGIGESVATGSLLHSASAAPAERPQSPGPKNHSSTLHNLVQLCLQQQPERRWLNNQSLLGYYSFSGLIYAHFTALHLFEKVNFKNELFIFQTISINAFDPCFLQAGGLAASLSKFCVFTINNKNHTKGKVTYFS